MLGRSFLLLTGFTVCDRGFWKETCFCLGGAGHSSVVV
jgi:hypothetical protein